MGKTKEMAIMLKAESFEEMQFAQDFTKKEAKAKGQELAKTILDNGNANPVEVMATLVRLSEVINTFSETLKKDLNISENETTFNGVHFKTRQGYPIYDYSADGMIDHYEKLLKQRKDLIKQASKTGKPAIDPNNGEVIEGVPIKGYTKDSIVITF